MLETSEYSKETVRALQRKLYLKAKHQGRCACLRKKNIGKPYAGEPRVRFDEGEPR